MSGKGGARHFSKPVVDLGILYKVMKSHQDTISDLGAYETVSKNQATNFQGLVDILDLITDLTKVSPTCEIASGPVRSTLMRLVMDQPSLNQTDFNGEVWSNLRNERLTTIFAHFRRLKIDKEMRKAAAKLKSSDYKKLQKAVGIMATKDKSAEEESPLPKKRKVDMDAVSLDSQGYPKELQTPTRNTLTKGAVPNDAETLAKGQEAASTSGQSPVPTFLRRRVGKMAMGSDKEWKAEDHDAGLAKAMGLTKAVGKAACKKPAASSADKTKKQLDKRERCTCQKNRSEAKW